MLTTRVKEITVRNLINTPLQVERFMFLIGEQCPHVGNCLFLTTKTRESDLIQHYWIS